MLAYCHHCGTLTAITVLEDSIQDCLQRLNHTLLTTLFAEEDELQDRLTDQDRDTTVFAPSEKALMDTDRDSTMLAGHVVDGLRRCGQLYHRHRIPALADGHFIHITSVRVSE